MKATPPSSHPNHCYYLELFSLHESKPPARHAPKSGPPHNTAIRLITEWRGRKAVVGGAPPPLPFSPLPPLEGVELRCEPTHVQNRLSGNALLPDQVCQQNWYAVLP